MTEAENNAATEFSHAEWNAANLDKFNNADKSRQVGYFFVSYGF